MARASFLWDDETQSWQPKHLVLAKRYQAKPKRHSSLPCPRIITDGMDEIKSMADGRVYSSKSAYYKSVHRAGCEIVGFDASWTDHVNSTYDEKAHEAELVSDVKRAIAEESSK